MNNYENQNKINKSFIKKKNKHFKLFLRFANIILSIPVIILFCFLKIFLNIKLGHINTRTIGNSTYCMEVFFSEMKSEIHNKKAIYLWFTDNQIANMFWYKKLKENFIILPGFLLINSYNLFRKINIFKSFLIPIRYYLGENNYHLIKNKYDLYPCVDIYKVTKNFENSLICKFSKDEIKKGDEYLKSVGINSNEKFICFSSRSSEYNNEKFISVRNANINTYKKGILFLIKNGFKAIRLGKNETKKLNWSNENIIDYAASGNHSDFLDFYLIHKCNFLISSDSGIRYVGALFKKNILILNYYNLRNLINEDGLYSKLILPKKILDKNNQPLSYKFLINSNIYINNKTIQNLNNNGLKLEDNNEDEIEKAIKEFFYIINDPLKQSDDKYNYYDQKIFLSEYDKIFKNVEFNKTNISSEFFKNNNKLFS